MCCCGDVGFDDGDYLLEDSREDNIVSARHTARRRMCVAHFTSQNQKCMINRILLAGSLGARKQNLRLRLHQTLTSKLRLSVPEASEAGDRPT